MQPESASPTKLWYLKHIRLFEGLGPAELQEMERITRMQEVRKRQPIYLQGDPANTVYLLKKGRVKISSMAPSVRDSRGGGNLWRVGSLRTVSTGHVGRSPR